MRLSTTCLLLLAGALAAQVRPAPAQVRGRPSAERSETPDSRSLPHPPSQAAAGSRDPFVDPFRRNAAAIEAIRPRGLAGIAVGELILRGLVQVGGSSVAVLESGDGRNYLVRGGEELFDGAVRSVTAGGVTLVRSGPGARRAGEDVVRLTLRPPHPKP